MIKPHMPKARSVPGGGPYSRHKCDPFNQGLDKVVALRLLSGKFEKKDLAAYHKTKWFEELREFAIQVYGSCVLCGATKNLQLHHRTYKHGLFDENISKDVTVLCARHHSNFHRGRR